MVVGGAVLRIARLMCRGALSGAQGKERPRTVYLGPLLCPTGRGEIIYHTKAVVESCNAFDLGSNFLGAAAEGSVGTAPNLAKHQPSRRCTRSRTKLDQVDCTPPYAVLCISGKRPAAWLAQPVDPGLGPLLVPRNGLHKSHPKGLYVDKALQLRCRTILAWGEVLGLGEYLGT